MDAVWDNYKGGRHPATTDHEKGLGLSTSRFHARSRIGDGVANVPIMTNVQMHRSVEGKPSWWVGVAVTTTVIVGE